eukprot:566464-Prymnesium_polylepis.1
MYRTDSTLYTLMRHAKPDRYTAVFKAKCGGGARRRGARAPRAAAMRRAVHGLAAAVRPCCR